MVSTWCSLTITLALVLYSGASFAKSDTAGEVTLLKGTAHVKPSTGVWTALQEGSSLRIGDHVRTGKKSRIEIHLVDASVIRLGSNTTLVIDTVLVADNGEREIKSSLLSGQAYANVSKQPNETSKFEINTKNAIAGVRGTAFRIDANKDASTVVRVYIGAVAVSNAPIYAKPVHTQDSSGTMAHGKPCRTPPGSVKPNRECQTEVAGPEEVTKKQWEEIVAQAMQEVRVGADGKLTKLDFESEPNAEEEEWVSWNKSRDTHP
jgi:hypothetical protein